MKFICTKKDLLDGINIVSKAVPSKTTMPILECVLITTCEDGISLTANDMELGIETVIPARIIESGTIAINERLFSEIVRKMPENDILVETDQFKKVEISCENAFFTLAGKEGEDFSYLPYIEKEKSIYLSEFSLKEIIRQTIFSISDNDSNKMMTGELFEIRGNKLKVVSLDGHRIAIRQIELKESFEDMDVIVPGKTLIELRKILSDDQDEEAKIFFSRNHCIFEFGKTKVISRIIEGEYFKVNRMLSSDYETKVVINKKNLINSVERASLLVREGDKKPIIMTISEGKMEIKMKNPIGNMEEKIDIYKEGRDIMIGFNPKFILDALRVIDEEDVTIYLINSKSPCFIRDDEGKYIYLILPVDFNIAKN